MSPDKAVPFFQHVREKLRNRTYRVLECRKVYCLAMEAKNGEQQSSRGGMIKVQPERQEEYGRDEIEGISVLGRADDDHGAEFAAKHYSDSRASRDRKAGGLAEANRRGARSGFAGNWQDCRDATSGRPGRGPRDAGGFWGIFEENGARVVDCCLRDFRSDDRGHGAKTHGRVG